MKIAGGKYRGKNIEARPDRTLRPTSGRIREAIFNILKPGRFRKDAHFIADDNPDLVEDRRVVDIFCGTGALGIEALSRGASHCTFIDQNPRTLAMAEANISHIGEKDNARFLRSDSTELPRAPMPCDLAFIDPPYNQNLAIPGLLSLKESGWLSPGAIIILEHGKQDDPQEVEGFTLLDTRLHDKTRITVMQYSG